MWEIYFFRGMWRIFKFFLLSTAGEICGKKSVNEGFERDWKCWSIKKRKQNIVLNKKSDANANFLFKISESICELFSCRINSLWILKKLWNQWKEFQRVWRKNNEKCINKKRQRIIFIKIQSWKIANCPSLFTKTFFIVHCSTLCRYLQASLSVSQQRGKFAFHHLPYPQHTMHVSSPHIRRVNAESLNNNEVSKSWIWD